MPSIDRCSRRRCTSTISIARWRSTVTSSVCACSSPDPGSRQWMRGSRACCFCFSAVARWKRCHCRPAAFPRTMVRVRPTWRLPSPGIRSASGYATSRRTMWASKAACNGPRAARACTPRPRGSLAGARDAGDVGYLLKGTGGRGDGGTGDGERGTGGHGGHGDRGTGGQGDRGTGGQGDRGTGGQGGRGRSEVRGQRSKGKGQER